MRRAFRRLGTVDYQDRLEQAGDLAALYQKTVGHPVLSTMVAPAATDPAINNWLDPHFVAIHSEHALLGKLFVFLCGSRGVPARQRLLTLLAARLGYHAINLSYPNSWTVGGLCRDSRDPDCHGKVRLDIIDGLDRSGLVGLDAANSIQNRLERLLVYLTHHYPAQGWERFLSSTGIAWPSVVIAGHSQGGGHAAVIAKQHAVARVVMFAAPVDFVRSARAHARWLSEPGRTELRRYFGFVHARDEGFDRIIACWRLLGMEQNEPLIDADSASSASSLRGQCMVTSVESIRRSRFHGCVVQDNLTPVTPDGRLRFEPVWRYLLGDHG